MRLSKRPFRVAVVFLVTFLCSGTTILGQQRPSQDSRSVRPHDRISGTVDPTDVIPATATSTPSPCPSSTRAAPPRSSAWTA